MLLDHAAFQNRAGPHKSFYASASVRHRYCVSGGAVTLLLLRQRFLRFFPPVHRFDIKGTPRIVLLCIIIIIIIIIVITIIILYIFKNTHITAQNGERNVPEN
jgi:hypothetical protein